MAETETGTGEAVVETDSGAVVVVDVSVEEEVAAAGLEVAEEDMAEVVATGEAAVVSRASSPEEDFEPSTGPGSACSLSRRTSTTPPTIVKTWIPAM